MKSDKFLSSESVSHESTYRFGLLVSISATLDHNNSEDRDEHEDHDGRLQVEFEWQACPFNVSCV